MAMNWDFSGLALDDCGRVPLSPTSRTGRSGVAERG
jgi:hypothetical protein